MVTLYVSALHSSPDSGDAVFDRNVLLHLRKVHPVQTLSLFPTAAFFATIYAAIKRVPPFAARYSSDFNRRRLIHRLKNLNVERAILSHAFAAQFAAKVNIPKIIILHNLESDIYRFDNSIIGRLTRRLCYKFEDSIFKQRALFVVLSEYDRELVLKRTSNQLNPNVMNPGMPNKYIPLSNGAKFFTEIVITGTYGWRMKLRDLELFMNEWRRKNFSYPLFVGSHAMPLFKKAGISFKSIIDHDCSARLGIGLITDRFLGGFKLKALEYIAMNCIVLTFSDIRKEFNGLPGADRYIHYIKNVDQIETISDAIHHGRLGDIASGFSDFKKACYQRFDWEKQLKRVMIKLEAIS